MTRPSSLRIEKKRQTRERIARAAMQLFSEGGYEETTVDEIAEKAGVSRRTLFRYFPAKELIVSSYQELYVQKFRDALMVEQDPLPLVRIRAAFRQVAEEVVNNAPEMLLHRSIVENSPALLAHDMALDRDIERAVVECLAEAKGERAPSYTTRVTAAALFGGFLVAFQTWRDSDGQKDLVRLGLKAFRQIEKGFGSDMASR